MSQLKNANEIKNWFKTLNNQGMCIINDKLYHSVPWCTAKINIKIIKNKIIFKCTECKKESKIELD